MYQIQTNNYCFCIIQTKENEICYYIENGIIHFLYSISKKNTNKKKY